MGFEEVIFFFDRLQRHLYNQTSLLALFSKEALFRRTVSAEKKLGETKPSQHLQIKTYLTLESII